MKTKAAVLHEMALERPYDKSKPLKIEEVELLDPGVNEVVVKVKAAGLCHSDLSVINATRPRPLPMVLGHEASGEVVEVGPGVTHLAKGDHVVFVFLPSCGHCLPCQTGKVALCDTGAKTNGEGTLLSGELKIKSGSRRYYHHLGVSGFAEYAVVSTHSLVKVRKDIPFEISALFGCAVMTGVGAVINTSTIRLGDTVMVVGLGGVGLSAILGAKAAGASKIIAADINKDKRAMAERLGADYSLDPSEPHALEKLKDYTSGGVDISVEFAGAMPALSFAFEGTKRGGVTVTGALPHPDDSLALSPLALVAQEKSLKGCYLGSCVPIRDIPAYLELYAAGRLAVDKLITHRLTLEEINEGFERLAKGDAIRQIITFEHA